MDKQITSKELRAVLGGISDMSLWRFIHDPYLKFPKPTYIKRRRFWSQNELEAWFIPYLDLNGENIEMTNFWSSLNIHFGQDTRKNKLLCDMALHAENPKRPEPLHYKIEADDEL